MSHSSHHLLSKNNTPSIEHNARAWNELAREQVALTQPARDDEFQDPLNTIDPLGWLGSNISNKQVLCLAAGGGRQSALYAAAGAQVTVVDISREMLALDRQVALERELDISAIETSMDDLSMFTPQQFDIVIHPVSTCYLPNVMDVFLQVARVTMPNGLYVSQHKSPVSLQTEPCSSNKGYRLTLPYYRSGPLPESRPSRVRERGTLEYLHRWEELIGGICRAGFAIEDFVEPLHAETEAEPGTFADRSRYVAPYLRIKARRAADVGQTKSIRLI